MRIAIMSDSHDNIWNINKAKNILTTCNTILHCGDLIAPFVIVQLAEILNGIPLHIVWGNNDGDKRLLSQKADQAKNVFIHGEFAELEFDGIKIAMNHYPEIARAIAVAGFYELVCYGHDHTAHMEKIGDTLLLNPGEIMGMKGTPSLAIYDTDTKEAEKILL